MKKKIKDYTFYTYENGEFKKIELSNQPIEIDIDLHNVIDEIEYEELFEMQLSIGIEAKA